jgi:L-arabinokinase
MAMRTVVFYVSGHGYGHATRDIEVINSLFLRNADLRVVVRSAVPASFFKSSLRGLVDLTPLDTDSGVAQIDSLRLDEDETARRASGFYRTFAARVKAEAAVLRQLKTSVVVGDVPPLAFAAAHDAGIPSVALANFTWDWIYEGYPQFESLAPGVVAIIQDAYAKTTRALRLPLSGGFTAMAAIANVVRDIPFIARRSRYSRDEVRTMLNLDAGSPIVLASFGAYGANLPYREIARRGRFLLLVTDHEAPDEGVDAAHLRRFRMDDLVAQGFRYEDIVRAADLVVTKPGYGIVSECIANQSAILYTSRGRFPEYEVIVSELPKLVRSRYLSGGDLLSGRWEEAIEALLLQPEPPERAPINGADLAADEILSLI